MAGERDESKENLSTNPKDESRIHGHRIGREKMAVRREREFSFPRLVVIFVLLSSRPRNLLSYLVFFTPTKRYQEVDGVRKEKERLTTDFSSLSSLSPSFFSRVKVLQHGFETREGREREASVRLGHKSPRQR